MSGLTAVAADNNYIYLADKQAAKVYVFNQIPTATSAPVFTLPGCPAATQLRSDGNYLVLTCIANPGTFVWTISALANNQAGTSVTGTQFNLPMGGLPVNGGLFVADTGFDRVVWWSSMSTALAGGAPTAVLGASTGATKANSGLAINKFRMPRSLMVTHGYLWVGEQKFGNRVLRFKLG
jgi:DNA-binding beta-propeller fold protein YncE